MKQHAHVAAPLLALSLLMSACPEDSPSIPSPRPSADASTATDAGMPATDAAARSTDAAGPVDPSPADPYAELAARQLAKAKACGFYEPSADPDIYLVLDAYDACLATCVIDAPCARLTGMLCDALESFTCWDDCELEGVPADGYRCRDGTRIPHAYLCDFEADCQGGEDEASCGEYRCASGETLPNSMARCDYIADCADESDELGCSLSCD
jgi:Low-density lipoprotein receptor domain class A